MITRIEMYGFTCCTTKWIIKNDYLTFEALYGYRNGEIWHACYEVTEQGDVLSAFSPLQKLTSIGNLEPTDIKIITRSSNGKRE